MELKEFFLIVWQRKKIFFFLFFSVIFLAGVWFFSQPSKFEVLLPVDVARKNYQKTDEFRYDQFYRFQADEKFSENVVFWVGGPDFIQLINEKLLSENNYLSIKNLRAEKMSSSHLRIFFEISNSKNFEKVTDIIENILDEKLGAMNWKAQDPMWFIFIFGEPIVSEKKIDFKIFLFATIILGFIFGVFGALINFYWQSNENRN